MQAFIVDKVFSTVQDKNDNLFKAPATLLYGFSPLTAAFTTSMPPSKPRTTSSSQFRASRNLQFGFQPVTDGRKSHHMRWRRSKIHSGKPKNL